VALVHDWLTGYRGGEKCLEMLAQAFPQAALHTLIHVPGSVPASIERLKIQTSPLQRMPGIGRHYRHLLPLMPLAARAWRLGNVDLVVSLSHCVAKAVRTPPGVPHVCYCFTPMRYAWHGREAYLANWSHRKVRAALAGWTLDRLRAWDRRSARGVTHFVAISQTVKSRIAQAYQRESHVIHPPVDVDFYTPDPAVRRSDAYLCVSALVPYKRIDQAIEACNRLARPLRIIGAGPDRERLERLAGPTIQFLGWQTNESIRDHLRAARALLFPGEEDFGIVPVEALACGTPVIALNRGGAAETVAPDCGHLYDAPSTDGLISAITRWENMGSPCDAAAARARAKAFSAARFRQEILQFLDRVVSQSQTPALASAPKRRHRPIQAPLPR
jgi:glycosyltransferase involved in cell wall biosynthesis